MQEYPLSHRAGPGAKVQRCSRCERDDLYSVFAGAAHRSRQQGEPVRIRLHFALGELGQADKILACDLLI